jgi:hypothetical protein
LEELDLPDEDRAFEEDGFDRLPDDRVAGDFLDPELLEGAALRWGCVLLEGAALR